MTRLFVAPPQARRGPSGAVLALVASTLIVAGCGAGTAGVPAAAPEAAPEAAERDLVVLDAAARTRAGIVVSTVAEVSRADVVEAPGIVALNEARTARIGSLTDGIVVDVMVQIGDRVRPRQTLANLHSHVVHDAWAAYRKAKADERRLVTELGYASDALARAERLIADKAIAQQELQRARANKVAAEEALDMGRTEIRRAEEELEHLGITNGDDPTGESGEQIPVRTPFAGVVLERFVTQGTAVNPGTPLFVVSDLSTVWVIAELDEAHIAGAEVGRPVSVRVPAYASEVFSGTVTYIGQTVNPKTRRVTVRCEVPNSDGRLKPEMYATVQLAESQPRAVTVVPAAALQTVDGRPSVFVAEGEAENQFRLRPVETGPDRDGLTEIRSGVRAGERVVTAGAFILKSELLKASDPGE